MTRVTLPIVNSAALIRDLLARIDSQAGGILLVVDSDGQLTRTVSDGDIRRALLAGIGLDDPASALVDKLPWSIGPDDSPECAYQLMLEHKVDQIPQLDEGNRPIRLYERGDFDDKVWLSMPHMGLDERRFVDEAFETNWIAPLGPNVDAFEQEIADYVGVDHAAALSSGTAALHLALILLDVKVGDQVLCSDLTFVASANPILYQGAEPVLIDCEPGSWNMSPQALERALAEAKARNRMPRAVIVVNLYGQQANMAELMPIADAYGVPIVEDAAESLGAIYQGRHSGSFGAMGVFSFNGNKIITTSGGGMLVSDDRALIERARFLSTQAKENSPFYLHKDIGFNYRMSNVLAGIGRGQLGVLPDRVSARRDVYAAYRTALADVDELQWVEEPSNSIGTHWLSVALMDESRSSLGPGDLIARLQEKNIEARHVWRPMHMQPLYTEATIYPHEPDGPMLSRQMFERGICLPSSSNLTDGQQHRAVLAIRQVFDKK